MKSWGFAITSMTEYRHARLTTYDVRLTTNDMLSRWNDAEAARHAGPLELRVYTSRLLGQEPSLVLQGGGNTSVKASGTNLFGETEELLYIKGSGWDLKSIEAAGFAPVKLEALKRIGGAQRSRRTNPAAPTPSVEAILHAIIPFSFVDHTHADAVVTISNTPDGEQRLHEVYRDTVFIVPYVMPGFLLARVVRELTRGLDWKAVEGVVLLNHGIFTFGPEARTSYERMIALVTRAERYLARHGAGEIGSRAFPVAASDAVAPLDLRSLAELRRAVGRAKGTPVVAAVVQSPGAVVFSARADAAEIAQRGPLTPDHVVRTKRLPLVGAGDWEPRVERYVAEYRSE